MNKGAMAILLDLVIDKSAPTLCESLGINTGLYYWEGDFQCIENDCGCRKFREYEILGALPEPMIWECKKCQARYGKYPTEKMEEILSKVQGLWTNPSDWDHVSKVDYN